MKPKTKLKTYAKYALIPISCLLVGAYFASIVPQRFEDNKIKLSSRMEPYGVVSNVENCQQEKFRLNCQVKTSLQTFNSDVTNWPGHILQPGDTIGIRIDEYKNSYVYLNCKDDECRCYWSCNKGHDCESIYKNNSDYLHKVLLLR